MSILDMIDTIITVGPWVFLGAVLLFGLRAYGIGPAWIWSTRERRISFRQAAFVRRSWRRTALNLNLSLRDTAPSLRERMDGRTTAQHPVTRIPSIAVKADDFGIIVTASTIPGVGRDQWVKQTPHLADAWRMTRVAVTQATPSRLTVRAVRRDPLIYPIEHRITGQAPATLDRVWIGLDEYAEDVALRLAGVAGMGIYGLPGAGKSSLINTLVSTLAPHPAVQFVTIDGKGASDFDELEPRLALSLQDDMEEASDAIADLTKVREWRAKHIRESLGRKNAWAQGGPSEQWPLIVTILDECHTFFSQVKDGRDDKLKRRNALAAQNTMAIEDLVKKGRSLGMLTILATQKGTGDAIPTQIRDVCSVSLSFACRTEEAAVAALGSDIRNYPEANPVNLQGPDYIGVASMVVEGRPGFTRVRTAYTPDTVAADVCRQTASLALTGFEGSGGGLVDRIASAGRVRAIEAPSRGDDDES